MRSTHHSTAQGAFNSAQYYAYQGYPLPLIFICEDNGIGISVPTPSSWITSQFSARPIYVILPVMVLMWQMFI